MNRHTVTALLMTMTMALSSAGHSELVLADAVPIECENEIDASEVLDEVHAENIPSLNIEETQPEDEENVSATYTDLEFPEDNPRETAEDSDNQKALSVFGDDYELLSETPTEYQICCEALRVHSEPTLESPKVSSIPYGQTATVSYVVSIKDGDEIWGVLDDGFMCLYSGRLSHARISGSLSDDVPDVNVLACLMMHEAKWEGTEGLTAVAEVVMNRVHSDLFPDSIKEVVYQPGQFSYVSEIGMCYPTPECLEIAQKIVEGGEGVLNRDDVLYFRNAVTCGADPESNWGKHRFVTQVNHHSFYTQD